MQYAQSYHQTSAEDAPAPATPDTPPAITTTEWPRCQNCQQSATSVYNGKHACTRCGWVFGNPFHGRITTKG